MNAPTVDGKSQVITDRDKPLVWVFGDFETFWAADYSLTHMDPPSYILDPRFQVICLGFAIGSRDVLVADSSVVGDVVESLRALQDAGYRVAFVSHNALFDACILSWKYQWVPDLIVCTMSMARSYLRHEIKSVSLVSVAAHFGWIKGDMARRAMGMGREDLVANGMWEDYTAYCRNDTALCRDIFYRLLPHMPPEEIILQDIILRCAVEPQFIADIPILHEHLEHTKWEKAKLFAKAMFAGLESKDQLMSNNQFAELLIRMGVDPPRKISPTTGLTTYDFNKASRDFLALLEHDDPRIIALVEARLAFKSTIEETRAKRMINIARLTFDGRPEGIMPIPLKMGAAITHRLGGDWKLNPQNWGRKSPIRRAMRAPDGHKVVVADKSQIEARMNAWFCGQDDLLDQFRRGEDVYANFASEVFGYPVTKKTHPPERFTGKTGILQLGYQSWWPKFKNTVWLQSYNELDEPIELSDLQAENIVVSYRNRMAAISGMWKRFQTVIPQMVYGGQFEFGPVTVDGSTLTGPNGLRIIYQNLRLAGHDNEYGRDEYVYDYDGMTYKLYGGKFLENIIQFLARIDTMQDIVRLKPLMAQFHSRLTHTSHDEIIYIVKDEFVDAAVATLRAEMTRVPGWATGLPLAVEIGVGQSYGEAK
jgi:DNA polymerase